MQRIFRLQSLATLRGRNQFFLVKKQRVLSTPQFTRFSTKTSVENAAESGKAELAPITFKESVSIFSKLSAIAAIGGIVLVSGYLIVKELFPSDMSPNVLFSRTVTYLRNHAEVKAYVGDNFKAYGRDLNTTKEGRRNYVYHDKYTDLNGTKFLRVRFVIDGPNGKANIYAEKSNQSDEFNYIIMEKNIRGMPQAIALIDNRVEMSREEIQQRVSEKFNKAGAKLFGHTNCQWTQRQLVEFGDFAKDLKVFMCDKEENKATCEAAGLKGYPSWVIGAEQLPGFQPLSQLKEIAQHI